MVSYASVKERGSALFASLAAMPSKPRRLSGLSANQKRADVVGSSSSEFFEGEKRASIDRVAQRLKSGRSLYRGRRPALLPNESVFGLDERRTVPRLLREDAEEER